jgi:CheY-like chemotaxis protein
MATILLVDDDQDILNFGKKVLASVGHDVLTANDAMEAVDVLNTHSLDLIISDANMPVHSGFDLLKTLKSEDRFKNIPVALLTARREREDIEQAIKLGVDDYIVKPIDPSLLVRKVEGLLKKVPPRERATFDLQEVATRMQGFVKIEAEILSVSEVGLVIETPQALFEGQILQIDAPIFHSIQIKPPVMKILSCENHKTLNKWRSRVLFVGTTDATLQRIRAWINAEAVKRRSRVA